MMQYVFRSVALAAFLIVSAATAAETDPLPSWNDGASKQAIIDFVTRVTQEDGPDYVPPNDRVATFDNDGTLWAEKGGLFPASVRH
jgi:hypothetical protein